MTLEQALFKQSVEVAPEVVQTAPEPYVTDDFLVCSIVGRYVGHPVASIEVQPECCGRVVLVSITPLKNPDPILPVALLDMSALHYEVMRKYYRVTERITSGVVWPWTRRSARRWAKIASMTLGGLSLPEATFFTRGLYAAWLGEAK